MFIRAAIFVLIFPLQFGSTKNNYDIVIHNMDCVIVAKKYVNFMNCQLLRQRNAVVASQFSMNETINQFDISCTFDLFKKDKTRMNVAKFKMDGCKYLASMYQNNIMGRLFKRMKAVSNLPANCPIAKGKVYEIRNYTFNSDEFPPGAPQAIWQMRVKFLKLSELAVEVVLDGSVIHNT